MYPILIILILLAGAIAICVSYAIGQCHAYDEGYQNCNKFWEQCTVRRGLAEWIVINQDTGRTAWKWKVEEPSDSGLKGTGDP